MLTTMNLKSFTVFPDATFNFGKGCNVFIGENGSGKSHALKAAYTSVWIGVKGEKESGSATPTKTYLQSAVARKMNGVFKPDELGRLARRQIGKSRCELLVNFEDASLNMSYSFNTTSKTEVTIEKVPKAWGKQTPIFLPTRELLTIYPGFVSLYETTQSKEYMELE
jgi:AAA15 family ATPase/GTPase